MRRWRGAAYEIEVKNPNGVEKGVKEIFVDGKRVDSIPAPSGSKCYKVTVIMG